MSSVRGATNRGKGRGSTTPAPTRGRGRGTSSTRGRIFNENSQRSNDETRDTFGQPLEPNARRPPRGPSNARTNGFSAQQPSQTGAVGGARTRGSWQERYQALTKARERERADAIRRGLIADPEKPRSLSEAITPAGTCQDMCAEYERVQRVVQKDVWNEETDPNHSAFATTEDEPDESRMVKKFRRAAAGLEEQLPSDLRPAAILRRTCDYLFDDVIGNAASLARVHHFVWDRTRAIRNDFSIQQITKPEDLLIAIECYERIARFHILSLHQLALPEKPYSKYDWQQEREQLDRTLLSLMQYYDDSRGRIGLPNEAEFRAYCVIFQLQDPTPDLEDRVQSWRRDIVQDVRVQKALDLYMAACNVMDAQGPLKPRANHLIARQDWQRFWTLVASKEVSYLMGCVAEIYFNLVRRTVLNALFRTSRANTSLATPDWTADLLCDLLAFDDGDEVYTYCERFGFTFKEREDGQQYLDLSSVRGKTLPEPSAGIPKQSKTSLVEDKRFGRTLPAIINGFTVKHAQEIGMVKEVEESDHGMEDVVENEDQREALMNGTQNKSSDTVDDGESLFIPESKRTDFLHTPTSTFVTDGLHDTTSQAPSAFGGFANGSNFGKPSSYGDNSSVFAPAQKQPAQSTQATGFGTGPPKFNFLQSAATSAGGTTTSASTFEFTGQKGSAPGNASNQEINSATKFSFGEQFGSQGNVFSSAKPPTQSATAPSFQFSGSKAALPKPTSSGEETSPFTSTFAPTTDQKPSSPDQAKPQISFARSTGAPASMPIQQSENNLKASQPHFTPSPIPSLSNPNSTSGLTASIKRPSFSSDTRPKKPSPLSNSLSANEYTANAIGSESVGGATENQPIKELLPDERNQKPKAASTYTRDLAEPQVSPAAEAFNSIVARVAEEFFSDPIGGVLKHYVDFHVKQTIREVHDSIETERREAEATKFRHSKLLEKSIRRWRDVVGRRRLAKSGRERRQRRQRRLQERGSQQTDNGSLFGTESMSGDSRAGSISEPRNQGFNTSREVVDSMYEQLGHGERRLWAMTNNQQAQSGSKRPPSSNGHEKSGVPRESGHKRLKSTNHVDDRGRVVKPSAANHPNADILKRSSFLGFSLSKDGSNNKNTTKSNYFRLKALGIHRVDDMVTPRGTKRQLSESLQASSQTPPPALRSPSLLRQSPEQPLQQSLMSPPTSAAPFFQKTNNDDEALFARLKSARENLQDSASYLKSEVDKGDDLRHSMHSSRSSNEYESPSMVRVRAEARLRASQVGSERGVPSTQRSVPAYRLRESRFVPREHYGKAIERAKEIRESRSRETSRPESPIGEELAELQPKSFPPAMQSESNRSQIDSQVDDIVPKANGPYDTSHSAEKHPTSSAFAPAANTFSGFTPQPQAPVSFANHTTQMSSQNPFLQATTSISFNTHLAPSNQSSFNNYGLQLTSAFKNNNSQALGPQDHTIQPSQINQALANSFGTSHGNGRNEFLSVPQQTPTAPQQNSYLQSQTISLLSDDEDDAPVTSASRTQVYSAAETDATDNLFDESSDEDELENNHAHANPYAALSDQAESEEDGQDWNSQVDYGDENDEEQDEGLNGYADDEEEGEESVDGELDEDVSEDTDANENEGEDGHEYECDQHEAQREYEYQHEHTQWAHHPYGSQWDAMPPKNTTLQEVGNTVEEAIELSD